MNGRLYIWLRSVISGIYQRPRNVPSYKPGTTLQEMHEARKIYFNRVYMPAKRKRLIREGKKTGFSNSQKEFNDYMKDMGICFGISGGDKEMRKEVEEEYYRRSRL